jgi:hypothetical protein
MGNDGGLVLFAARRSRCRQDLLQLQPRVADVAQAPVLLFLETAPQQPDERGRRLLRQRLPVRLAIQDRRHRVGEGRALEGPLPGKHLVQHAAESPDVAATVRVLTPRLLGTHVRRGP